VLRQRLEKVSRRSDDFPFITEAWLQKICSKELEFPNAFDRVENLIIFLAEILMAGETLRLTLHTCQAAAGSSDRKVLSWVLQSALEQGWITGKAAEHWDESVEILNGTLTLESWRWYAETGNHRS
jgi:hypothetical protein